MMMDLHGIIILKSGNAQQQLMHGRSYQFQSFFMENKVSSFSKFVSQLSSVHLRRKTLQEFPIDAIKALLKTIHTKNDIVAVHEELLAKKKRVKPARPWTPSESAILGWAILKISEETGRATADLDDRDWKQINQIFEDRSLSECRYQWLVLCQQNKTDQFSPEEDMLLRSIIQRTGVKCRWGQIAKIIFQESGDRFFKKPKQYRQRWINYLDDQIKRDAWTLQQDKLLVRLMRQKGKKWSVIGKLMNRTENAVKNHAKSMANKAFSKASGRNKNFFNERNIDSTLTKIEQMFPKNQHAKSKPTAPFSPRCQLAESLISSNTTLTPRLEGAMEYPMFSPLMSPIFFTSLSAMSPSLMLTSCSQFMLPSGPSNIGFKHYTQSDHKKHD